MPKLTETSIIAIQSRNFRRPEIFSPLNSFSSSFKAFPEIFFKTFRQLLRIDFFRSIPEKELKHRLLIGRSGFPEVLSFHRDGSSNVFFLLSGHESPHNPAGLAVKDQRKQVRKTHGAAIDCPCFGAVHLLRRIIKPPGRTSHDSEKSQG